MPNDPLFNEEYRFNPIPFLPDKKSIQLYAAFHSCWQPGFVSAGGGGQYAVYALVKNGSYRVFTDDGKSLTITGVCFYCGRSRHKYLRAEVTGKEPLVRKAVMLHQNAFHDMLSTNFFPAHNQIPLTEPDKLENIFDDIYSEMANTPPDEARLAGLFMQMLHEAARQQYISPYPERLNKALDFIAHNLHDPDLSREMIAAYCGMSIRSLSRMFTDLLGIPVAQHIIKLRLEKVCGMLGIPGMSIKEIADQCGFRNSIYLAGTFRKHFQTSPGKYREKLFSGQ